MSHASNFVDPIAMPVRIFFDGQFKLKYFPGEHGTVQALYCTVHIRATG